MPISPPFAPRPCAIIVRASAFALLCGATAAQAQIQRPGRLNEVYTQICANCHGPNMEGTPVAPSMLDDVWVHGGDDESLARSIRDGVLDKGMPAWSALLSEKDIRSMVIFIREQRERSRRGEIEFPQPVESMTVPTEKHAYQLNTWVDGLDDPWSLNFLPDGSAVVTEKRGRLYTITGGRLDPTPIRDVPVVDNRSQAGLYDVVPHPDYANNGWLYLSFSDPQTNVAGRDVSLTRIVRGKLRNGAFVEQQTIFQAPVAVYPNSGGVHFGGRIVFDGNGHVFFTIGERGNGDNAQNLAVPMGKVHRLFDDGRVPEDNPFVKNTDAVPSIWSYGHRNPQGLARHPVTGAIYDVEHGPRGGDEVNLVRPGRNYGWPVITYGMGYDGSAITDITAKEGMEQPVTYWVPSIAPCGANFYTGDRFPQWKNNLFVASLAVQELHRLEIDGDEMVHEEVIFKGLGRIRYVVTGPDGALYVCLPQRIARISPAE